MSVWRKYVGVVVAMAESDCEGLPMLWVEDGLVVSVDDDVEDIELLSPVALR